VILTAYVTKVNRTEPNRKRVWPVKITPLFHISEDHSKESYTSQAWSVRWRWQLFWACEGQGWDGYMNLTDFKN